MSKVAKIILTNKTSEEFGEIEVLDIIQSLYCNGQILKEYIIEESKNIFEATVTLTSSNALDEKNWIKEVKDAADKMDMTIQIGDNEILFGNNMICSCENPSFYILQCFGHSPLKCGDCLKGVSLVSFPDLNYLERCEFLSFVDMYISISNIGDYDLEYCVSQLENPNSKLNNLGIELCEKIQKKIKKPVYYLQLTDKNAQVCPKCGGILENLPIDINNYSEYCNIDKVCKKCNLVFETNKMEK